MQKIFYIWLYVKQQAAATQDLQDQGWTLHFVLMSGCPVKNREDHITTPWNIMRRHLKLSSPGFGDVNPNEKGLPTGPMQSEAACQPCMEYDVGGCFYGDVLAETQFDCPVA